MLNVLFSCEKNRNIDNVENEKNNEQSKQAQFSSKLPESKQSEFFVSNLKNGVVDYILPVYKGEIPSYSRIVTYKGELARASSLSKNPIIYGIEFDKYFGLIFYLKNRRLQCGVLAKDSIIKEYNFKKGSIVQFDEDGKLKFKGGSYESFKKQEWPDLEKIYFDDVDISNDNVKDGTNIYLNSLCYLGRITVKESFNLAGTKWAPDTLIEFCEYPDGLFYPCKVFARKGQKLDDQILSNDSILKYCWDRKLKKAVVEYVFERSMGDYITDSAGGNDCQWSLNYQGD